ncbi:uncharacterized protein LOC109540569 [Dendroctonus ponderosae]|uniref:VPS37 C-terminal domain-containing protein n=1 Tax=Dendroctonus ponderosae TaxID=77166 RepID=A0AAR5PU76_DENPD|nr:uncharacterized protein LOC109540569 [Dendroctonus ponderosae]KAH1007494.1 hypothetical protein HUJ04_004718 [Dendroctonus ponderosae]KAH1015001.1 hypothetical protein HUJ05_012789 [Dendroctonus ponderosae]
MTEDNKLCLPLDKDYVNSLDLPTLIKMLPMYESKHKEVTHRLEQVLTERTDLDQELAQSELVKHNLEKQFCSKQQAYQVVALREKNVQTELSRMSLMCPIYEFQMKHSLQNETILLSDTNKSAAPEPTMTQWLATEKKLNNQRELLVASMEEKQKDIDNFVTKHLK